MSAICRDSIGGARIGVHVRPSRMGAQRNYYLAVSHALVPEVTAIRFIGQNQDEALQSFTVSRENALAVQAMENWWVGS